MELGHNLLMQFPSLGSSKMVLHFPSSRCVAKGNKIWLVVKIVVVWYVQMSIWVA